MAELVPTLRLKRGSAKPLHAGHPWVFADAVAGLDGGPASPGAEVRVVDDRGTCIGRGLYSPQSAIAVRIITRADAPITPALIASRIDEALRLRREVLGLGAPTLSRADIPVGPAAAAQLLDEQDGNLLRELEAQIAKVESFAALYGMNALEETAELRKRRDELLKKTGGAAASGTLSRAPGAASGAVESRDGAGVYPDKTIGPAPPPQPAAVGPTFLSAQAAVPGTGATTAYRLVNSEGDGLGGLVVDVYGEYVVLQVGTPGIARFQEAILDALESRLRPRAILERSDNHARQLEKMAPAPAAALRGKAPEAPFSVYEYGVEMVCDLRPGRGQKTGLYLDQRENRRRASRFAAGRNVLDVCSYSGGFALHAARAGARSITLIDSSAEALELARANLERNGIADADLVCAEWTEGFKHLREAGRLFELLVLDPPKFARTKGKVSQALSAYRDLNAQAARLLAPGGILYTCSCSANVTEVDFERAVAGGLRQAGRRAALLERHGAAPDHPVPPGFEQGRYLKCLVLQVV